MEVGITRIRGDQTKITGTFKPVKKEEVLPEQKDIFAFDPSDHAVHDIMAKDNLIPVEKTKIFQKPAKIYADGHGRVKHLALQLSSYAGGAIRKEMLNAYKILFSKMEPDTKFTVVVENPQDKADVEKVIKESKVPNPERIKFIEPDLGLTVWARDQMISFQFPDDKDHVGLMSQTTLHSWHADDMEVPAHIANNNSNIVLDKERRIVTDGGDEVSNTKETFLGFFSQAATAERLHEMGRQSQDFRDDITDYYEKMTNNRVVKLDSPFEFKLVKDEITDGSHRTGLHLEKNPDYVKPTLREGEVSEGQMWLDMAHKLFQEEYGQPVTIMGADDPNTPEIEKPPSDHMDMGHTPIDEKNMFVGDPSLVKKIFKSMTPEEKQQASDRLSEMASLKASEESGKPVRVKVNVDDWLKRYETSGVSTQHNFDKNVEKLEKEGYNVMRLPHAPPQGGFSPYITYTNCLMEQFKKDDKEVKRVFLPINGIQKLDEYAIGKWKDIGFEVLPIPMGTLSSRWGLLRCVTQWLERSDG